MSAGGMRSGHMLVKLAALMVQGHQGCALSTAQLMMVLGAELT